jgi:A/G-specific adenine glycosylase
MNTKKKKMKKKKCDHDDAASVEDGDDGIQISQVIPAGDVLHVFSHVKKTYRTQWVVLEGGGSSPPALLVPKVVPPSDKPPVKGKRKAGVAAPEAKTKAPAGEDVKWVRIENIDQEK